MNDIRGKHMQINIDQDEQLYRAAHALASPVRIRIMRALGERSMNVGELAQKLDIPMSSAALAVKILEEAGMIMSETQPGARGAMKICSRKTDTIAISLMSEETRETNVMTLQMPIGGYSLAENIQQLRPDCRIIFCTGHSEYALDAFRIHVSGYLLKPITPEAVQREINHIKGVRAEEKLMTIKCFGNFEVLYDGKSLPFKRKKAKELLAVLVDRHGSGITAKQICAILFPDDTDDTKNAAYLRQLILDLKNTLKMIGAEDVLRHETPYYRIDTNLVSCDYFRYLEVGKPRFHGEYMTQYSWAESTCAMLQFKE